MTDTVERRMDVWEMRCWFKHGRFIERVQSGELKEIVRKSKLVKAASRQPKGTKSESVVYVEIATDSQVARIHRYVLPDGRIGPSGEPDPKSLVVAVVSFGLFEGDDQFKKDPCYLFPGFCWGAFRRPYGYFRKLCRLLLGPEMDGKLAMQITPALKLLCFWHPLLRKE